MRPSIIASIACSGNDELPEQGALGVVPADLVEVRLDALPPGDIQEAEMLCRTVTAWKRPLLLTPRCQAEGGIRSWSVEQRQTVLNSLWGFESVRYVDIELVSSSSLVEWALRHRPADVEIIASYHNFRCFPCDEQLDRLIHEALQKGVQRIKVAVQIDSVREAARLACWTQQQSDRISIISLALGPAGALSRIMNGAFGSWASYGYIDYPTAPGQLSVAELQAAFDRYFPVSSP